MLSLGATETQIVSSLPTCLFRGFKRISLLGFKLNVGTPAVAFSFGAPLNETTLVFLLPQNRYILHSVVLSVIEHIYCSN